MSDLVVLKPMAVSNSVAAERMREDAKKLSGRGDTRRISIRGGRFRLMLGGEQVGKPKSDPLNIIIVRNSPVGRTYYDSVYDPDDPQPPRCWSQDGEAPSPDVAKDERMSPTCAACKMNIKGSGQGQSRACRFSVRLALMLEGDPDHHIYQMQIPATSFFGKRSGTDMGLQAYTTYLTEQKNLLNSVVTEVRFDEDSETPRLFFRPIRNVDQEELDVADQLYESPAAEAAVTMTVFQADSPASEPDAPVRSEKKEVVEVADDDDDDDEPEAVAEPVKRNAKTSKKVEPDSGEDPLITSIAGW